jgi:hypothetical protein
MNLQFLIVALIVIGALAFAGRGMLKRARSFSAKSDCGVDCGCGDKSGKASI